MTDPKTLSDSQLISWVLECGCEPMVTHCAQCDARRKVRSAVMDERARQWKVDDLTALGYTVIPPGDSLEKTALAEVTTHARNGCCSETAWCHYHLGMRDGIEVVMLVLRGELK